MKKRELIGGLWLATFISLLCLKGMKVIGDKMEEREQKK